MGEHNVCEVGAPCDGHRRARDERPAPQLFADRPAEFGRSSSAAWAIGIDVLTERVWVPEGSALAPASLDVAGRARLSLLCSWVYTTSSLALILPGHPGRYGELPQRQGVQSWICMQRKTRLSMRRTSDRNVDQSSDFTQSTCKYTKLQRR